MAQAPRRPQQLSAQQQKMLQRKYYVHDPNVGNELGGTRVETEGEGDDIKRFVMMSPQQAKHWLELLAISDKHFSELDPKTQTQLDLMWGGKLKPRKEGEAAPQLRKVGVRMPVR